jgi:predicted nucleic acid-binding protein
VATGPELLLLDANVVIDYAITDPGVLGLVVRHIGRIYVVRSVLEEVEQIRERDCKRLGIEVVEPSLDQFVAAGSAERARLSFTDRLSLIVAHDSGWTCVTNDRALRRACRERRVPVWWGLQLMLALVRAGELVPAAALAVARAIHEDNTRHLTAEILDRFALEVARIELEVNPR